jgi:hypothetical protein
LTIIKNVAGEEILRRLTPLLKCCLKSLPGSSKHRKTMASKEQ